MASVLVSVKFNVIVSGSGRSTKETDVSLIANSAENTFLPERVVNSLVSALFPDSNMANPFFKYIPICVI